VLECGNILGGCEEFFFFFFSRFVKYEVRDGSKIRFWHDV